MNNLMNQRQHRKFLQIGGIAVTVAALITMALCIFTMVRSGQKLEMQEQIQKLEKQVQQIEKENEKLREELKDAQALIGVLSTAVEETEPEPEIAPSEKCVYLTFDDGPHANTDTILDILKEYEVEATFFVNGRESEADIVTYKRIAEEGHVVANHTYSHAYDEIYSSTGAFMEDVYKLEEMLLEKAEITMSKIVRFPGGSNNQIGEAWVLQDIKDTLTEQGYRYFDWNVSGEDAVREGVTAKEIYDEVIRTTKGKSNPVVLLHSGSIAAGTVEALPDIIEYYVNEGYTFCTLDKSYAPEVVLAARSE